MPNLFDSFKQQLEDWAEQHIFPRVLEIIADVLEAKPTTPDILRAKAAEFRKG